MRRTGKAHFDRWLERENFNWLARKVPAQERVRRRLQLERRFLLIYFYGSYVSLAAVVALNLLVIHLKTVRIVVPRCPPAAEMPDTRRAVDLAVWNC